MDLYTVSDFTLKKYQVYLPLLYMEYQQTPLDLAFVQYP